MQIKQELTQAQPQTPSEPPIPVVPPAEVEEMKAAIARLEAGLLQNAEGTGLIASHSHLRPELFYLWSLCWTCC